MKKNLLTTAFLVVTAAFIGCSSDDNLAELQGGDPVPAKGTPMTVTVSDGSGDATRYTNTTTDNIEYFQMWAYNTTNVSDQVMQIDGLLFSKSTGNNTKFTNSDANWPANNTDPCFFYAVSENVETGSDGMKENFEATGTGTSIAPKIKYSLPTTTGTVELPDNTQVLVPTETTIVDVDNTKDFLVCTSTNNGNGITEAVNGSDLSLVFDHALADLEIAARFTSYEWVDNARETMSVGDNAKLHVNYIAIHGLFTTGTYNFNSKTWTGLGGDFGTTRAVYKHAYAPNEKTISAQDAIVYSDPENKDTGTGGAKIKRTTIVPAGTFLIIPQSFTPWNKQDITAGEAEELAYIELNVSFEDFLDSDALDVFDDDYEDNKMSFYFPLVIPNNEFVGGKKHKLLLNLNNVQRPDDGDYMLKTVGFDTGN